MLATVRQVGSDKSVKQAFHLLESLKNELQIVVLIVHRDFSVLPKAQASVD